MRIKKGVSTLGLKPEMVAIFPVVDGVCRAYGVDATLTSGTEGKHGDFSRHHLGMATDWRIRHMKEGDPLKVVIVLKEVLPDDYNVILEHTHIHISFKPK